MGAPPATRYLITALNCSDNEREIECEEYGDGRLVSRSPHELSRQAGRLTLEQESEVHLAFSTGEPITMERCYSISLVADDSRDIVSTALLLVFFHRALLSRAKPNTSPPHRLVGTRKEATRMARRHDSTTTLPPVVAWNPSCF